MTGTDQMGAIALISPLKLIERTLYGQVQAINSLLHIQSSRTFLVWNLMVLAVILGICVYISVCIIKNRHRAAAIYAMILLLMSFGTMALQILSNAFNVTSDGWSVVRTLTRDRFWMFQYFGWLGVLILLYICIRSSGIWQRERIIRMAGTGMMALYMLMICSCQITDGQTQIYDSRLDAGDWVNYYYMGERQTYGILGFKNGQFYKSDDCRVLCDTAGKRCEADVQVNTDYAASVYAHKDTVENQLTLRPYYVNVYDGNGELVARKPQISDPTEYYAGFDLDVPVDGISRLEFTYEDGTPAFVDGECLLCYRG